MEEYGQNFDFHLTNWVRLEDKTQDKKKDALRTPVPCPAVVSSRPSLPRRPS